MTSIACIFSKNTGVHAVKAYYSERACATVSVLLLYIMINECIEDVCHMWIVEIVLYPEQLW